jgi:hypothetical protein
MGKVRYLKKQLPPNASKKHKELAVLLEEIFPFYTIVYEYSCDHAASRKGVEAESYGVQQQAFDFYVIELDMAIEMQGEQHYKENSFFGKGTMSRDVKKRNFCKDLGIDLVEISYKTTIDEQSIRELIGI